jgi:hypothetical protein
MATLRIKRRASGGGVGAPSSLANAELAFNEQSSILYYGTGTGGAGGTATSIIAIGGSGAFATPSYVDSALSSGVASAVASQLTNYAALAGASFSGNVTVAGNLTVNGTTTTINSTTVSVDDINVILGDTASPSDATSDGGGITLKGNSDKTLTWVSATSAWTSNQDFNLVSGRVYEINGTSVLSSTTLGSGVVGSSLTSVGTLSTGVWQGTAVAVGYGGTGLTSAVSGLLKGNGSAYSAAVAGTDFLAPSSDIDGGSF